MIYDLSLSLSLSHRELKRQTHVKTSYLECCLHTPNDNVNVG